MMPLLKKAAVLLMVLAALNFLGQYVFGQWDLTDDHRYTLADPTKELLKSLDREVRMRVLLEGDFPADIKRLQSGTREMLASFRAVTGRVSYSFEDPTKYSKDEMAALGRLLQRADIAPFNLREGKRGEKSEKTIFPAVIVEGVDTLAVNLLDAQTPGQPEEVIINNSISLLEYRLAKAIEKAVYTKNKVIAISTGRGELSGLQTFDLVDMTLKREYLVGRLHWDSLQIIDPQINLLLIAKPTKTFAERDKFLIDQYVMHGGKVIWLLDRLAVGLDSLMGRPVYVPYDYPLNLEDILYRYGVRLQPNLVLDLDCTQIPLQTGMAGGQPQYDLFNWYYYPLVRPFSEHPVVKNLDRIQLRFASTIDTIRTKTQVHKTMLLRTSEYSRLQFSPAELNFEILREDPQPEKFNQPHQPVAVMLEGVFPSAFENHAKSEHINLLTDKGLEFKNESLPTQMLVVSDGDVAANPVRQGRPLQLGQDEVSNYIYANKAFLMNAIEYMLDDGGLVLARNRELKLRLLDRQKAAQEKSYWQWLNLGLPLALLLVFGLLFHYIRKKRFAQ